MHIHKALTKFECCNIKKKKMYKLLKFDLHIFFSVKFAIATVVRSDELYAIV